MYLLSNFSPASRDTINQKQIDFKSNREYFRKRLINDFNKNIPALVIDYVKPRGYVFTSEENNIKSFTELNDILKKKYVKFENLNFRYKKTGIKVFESFNLKIKKGEKLGILGNVGSGKTTLLDLISRIYDPDVGQITFDNYDIKNYNTEDIRSRISDVPQNNFLFSESIEKNIGFGNISADFNKIKEAAIRAEINDEIEKVKNGYNTVLGERGVTLSGGQIQRVSISRSFLKKASIYLTL